MGVRYCTDIQIQTQYLSKRPARIALRPAACEETDHTVARLSAIIAGILPLSESIMQKPQVVASIPAHAGRVIQVSTERLRYSNGREYDNDLVRHPGAAAVVAIDNANRVCVVRQY